MTFTATDAPAYDLDHHQPMTPPPMTSDHHQPPPPPTNATPDCDAPTCDQVPPGRQALGPTFRIKSRGTTETGCATHFDAPDEPDLRLR